MFNLSITQNFRVGSYTFNTPAIKVVYEDLFYVGDKNSNVTVDGYYVLLIPDQKPAVVTAKYLTPAEAIETLIAAGFTLKHNWKTKSGYFEAYFVKDTAYAIRYLWHNERKAAVVQDCMVLDSFYLPVGAERDAKTAEDLVSTGTTFPTAILSAHDAELADRTFAIASKNESFQAEIQRVLLETPSTLHAIARIVSHAYMPISYKFAVNKSYVTAANAILANEPGSIEPVTIG